MSVHLAGLLYHPRWVSLSLWWKIYSKVSTQKTFGEMNGPQQGNETGCLNINENLMKNNNIK